MKFAILLAFFLLFAAGASKPLQLDNMDFPAVAAQTSISGVPVYYRGEQKPHELGLYHPPLYIYMLAGWIRIFGFGETQVRMFGMICCLLQGWITLELLRCLFGGAAARWAPWFWLIFLLNPYTIQTASIADIDSTIYGPLMCAALWAVLRISWRDGVWREDAIGRKEYALIAGCIVLCLWAKLTTVLLVFPFIFLLLIPRLSVGRAAMMTASVVGAGVAGFLITYWIYGKLTGLDIGYTFAFTWMSFVERGSSHTPGLAGKLRDFQNNASWMIPFMVRWTGLVPWLAAIGAIAMIRIRYRRVRHYGLLILLAALTTFYYCGKTGTFGFAPFKYVFVFWGLVLSAVVVPAFGIEKNSRALCVAIGAVVAAAALFAARFAGDHLILFNAAGAYKWFVLVPALAFAGGAVIRSNAVGRAMMMTGFGIYCGLQLGVALHQSKVDYATQYDYGQTGFMDTVAFLRLNTGPDEIIASMKDIGFRAHRRYFENYRPLYLDEVEEQAFVQAIASGVVKYEVFTEERGQDQLVVKPSLARWIAAHCELVRSFGNYRIYQYRAGS